RILSMLLQAFPHCLRRFALSLRKILVLHGWRRRRWRRGLQPAPYPCADKDWRCAVWIRSPHQDRGLAEQTKASLIGQFDSAELCAGDSRYSVVLRQPLVDKGGLRGQQIHNAVIL